MKKYNAFFKITKIISFPVEGKDNIDAIKKALDEIEEQSYCMDSEETEIKFQELVEFN